MDPIANRVSTSNVEATLLHKKSDCNRIVSAGKQSAISMLKLAPRGKKGDATLFLNLSSVARMDGIPEPGV